MKTVKVKRFRVFDIEEQKKIGQFDSLSECVKLLTPLWEIATKPASKGGNPYLDYMVDDVHDDTEVNWIDLMNAWKDGERPTDLQMF